MFSVSVFHICHATKDLTVVVNHQSKAMPSKYVYSASFLINYCFWLSSKYNISVFKFSRLTHATRRETCVCSSWFNKNKIIFFTGSTFSFQVVNSLWKRVEVRALSGGRQRHCAEMHQQGKLLQQQVENKSANNGDVRWTSGQRWLSVSCRLLSQPSTSTKGGPCVWNPSWWN